MDTLAQNVAPEIMGFLLTLILSLLIGFEREVTRPEGPDESESLFGGVRTFPLIALSGFLLVTAFDSAIPFAGGLLVLGALLAISHHATIKPDDLGITSEIAALLTYALGGSAAHGDYWISIATGVVAVMLLQEKRRMEWLVARIPRRELATMARFLLLTGVILPVVPNRSFTVFDINPFKIWLVVVAVSGVSYLSYLLQLRWRRGPGLLLAGLVGGVYSSTVTTVALARQSRAGSRSGIAYGGAITAATGVMYLRLWFLILLFAPPLAATLTAMFWSLGLAAIATGLLLARLSPATDSARDEGQRPRSNPLEPTSAFTFAGLFVAVLVITGLVADHYGEMGILAMAGIMGATDVDPFILGLTQVAGHGLDLETASLAVVVAASTNNVIKGLYAFAFGSRAAAITSFAALATLAAISMGLHLAF